MRSAEEGAFAEVGPRPDIKFAVCVCVCHSVSVCLGRDSFKTAERILLKFCTGTVERLMGAENDYLG